VSAPRAERRLIVIPHAGGGSGQYRHWAGRLPDDVRLEVLDLPGHATRMREPLVTVWDELAADLTGAVRARIAGAARSYVLAGHSLGAVLALEAARTLEGEGTPPELLIVSGRNAPTAGLSHRPLHTLPDDQLLAALDRLGGTPSSLLERPDAIGIYLPALRADLRLAETYTRSPGPPLSVPLSAFAGRQDRLTDGPSLVGWARETTATFELTIMSGGHFFHTDPAFAEALRSRLAGPGPTADPEPGLATHYSSLVDFTTR
jgi:medium-chain acyl-[acyl-carrier-protein] hydrolase